jgi:hypothetical protein
MHRPNLGRIVSAFEQARHLAKLLEMLDGCGHEAALNVVVQVGRGRGCTMWENVVLGQCIHLQVAGNGKGAD